MYYDIKKIIKEIDGNYGITEWDVKSIILTYDETIELYKSLIKGEDTVLTRLVKEPFPEFFYDYYEKIPGFTSELESFRFNNKVYDQLPYLLYVFPVFCKEFNDIIRKQEYTKNGFVNTINNYDLDDKAKYSPTPHGYKINSAAVRRIYISQYFNKEDFDKKIDYLDQINKDIACRLLGIRKYTKMQSVLDISRDYGFNNSATIIKNLYNMLIYALSKNYDEFEAYMDNIKKTNVVKGVTIKNVSYLKLYSDIAIIYAYRFMMDENQKYIYDHLSDNDSNIQKKERAIYVLKNIFNYSDKLLKSYLNDKVINSLIFDDTYNSYCADIDRQIEAYSKGETNNEKHNNINR